jgi:hypothetical protein
MLPALEHEQLVPAVNAYLKQHRGVLYACAFANLLSLAAAAYWIAADPGWDKRLYHSLAGLGAAYFFLVPVHEAIHALAYRAFGATTTGLHYRWRTLSAYCTADRFAIRGDRFLVVCFAPFAILSAVLAAAAISFPVAAPLLGGALVLHTGACSGDFGMAALALRYDPKSFWTWDSVAEARSYFCLLPPDGAAAD